MKINLLDTRKGEIRVVPEDVIDLHVLYTIINPGDKAYAWTLRQLKSRGSQGEKRKGERVKVYLGIDVKDLELDELRGCLKIKGVVIEAPDWLPIKGKHHSLLITVGREVRIVKGKIREFELKRLMHHVKRGYVKVIIVALDRDEATIAILRGNKVEILSKIASNIPGKDTSERERRKALNKYIDDIVKVIENIRGREKVDYVIVAGPGMIKDILARKIMEETIGLTVVKESATSGTESGIYEVLRRGAKIKVLKDLELVQAQKALEEFMRRISKGDRKIAYGIDDVQKAVEYGAAELVLVLIDLLKDFKTMEKTLTILEEAERRRTKTIVLSDRNSECYLTLKSLGGIIALLRYPLQYA